MIDGKVTDDASFWSPRHLYYTPVSHQYRTSIAPVSHQYHTPVSRLKRRFGVRPAPYRRHTGVAIPSIDQRQLIILEPTKICVLGFDKFMSEFYDKRWLIVWISDSRFKIYILHGIW